MSEEKEDELFEAGTEENPIVVDSMDKLNETFGQANMGGYAESLSHRIVSVQPLDAPAGMAYAFREIYNDDWVKEQEQNKMDYEIAGKLEDLGFGDEITDDILKEKINTEASWDMVP